MAVYSASISPINQSAIKMALAAAREAAAAYKIVKTRIRQKYNKRVKFGLELIAEHAVTDFYDSYSPHKYKRQEGLLTAYQIIADDDEWSIDTGSQYMTSEYRVDKDYIYENSFMRGWHGGAIDGPEHPNPETPWWKLHGEWYKPAKPGPAPIKYIDAEASKFLEEMEEAYGNEGASFIEQYIDKAESIIDSIL